jgi:hypothetical protein
MMNKKELAKKLVKEAYKHGNWANGSYYDDGMYYNDRQLADMVEKTMPEDEIKEYLNHHVELWFEFNFYVNSAGNQCGQYNDVDLYVDDEFVKTIYTTYDQKYADEWCR